MNALKKNKLTIPFFIFVNLVIFFYALSIEQDLVLKAGNELYLNYWDIVLSLLSDPYLFVYFILPIWLFVCVYHIEDSFDFTFIIRLENYNGWIIQVAKRMIKYLLMYLFILAIVLVLVFILGNYTLSNEWSLYSFNFINNFSNVDILSSLLQTGLSPISSLFFQLAYVIFFLYILFLLLCSMYVYAKKKSILIIGSCLIFLYSAVSFQFLPDNFSYLSAASYALLYHAYATFDSVLTALIVMCFFLVLLLSINTIARKKIIRKNYFLEIIPYLIYIVLILVGLITKILEYDGIGKTIGDFMFLKFYGVDSEGFALLQHIYYSIVFIGFGYLFQLYLHSVLTEKIFYELIRYKSYSTWFWGSMKKVVLCIFLFLVILLCLIVFIGALKDYQLSFENSIIGISNSAWITLYHFFVNSFLQILNYCLIVFIVSWIFNESYYGLIALGLSMVLMLPAINFTQLLPFGLNSFGLLTNLDVVRISISLFVCLGIEYIVILSLFKKKMSI